MHEFLPISLHSHWEADEQLTEMLWNLRRVTWSELHDYHIHVDGVDRLDLADDEKPYCVASLSLGLLHFT